MKKALVTGGRRGIGLGIAEELIKCGYKVFITGVSPEANNAIAVLGENARYIKCDSTDKKQRELLLDEVFADGGLDLLVNNAGIAPRVRSDLLEMSEESYDNVLDTNLKATFFMTQETAKRMIASFDENESRPQIINVSSMSAYTVSINRGEYCVAKAGISMMTQLFAARLAEYGINVYEIRPGIIKTDMTSAVNDKYNALINEGLLPIKRWGEPEDIGRAVRAIAEGCFPYSTGEIFNIDGGFHIRRL